jgi:glycosyltransferase involved in cell wall biosynthesis
VLAQSYGALELIVVDDGSTDETPDVLAAIRDPRLRRIRTPHRGIGAALNTGLAAAAGVLIASSTRTTSGCRPCSRIRLARWRHVRTSTSCTPVPR